MGARRPFLMNPVPGFSLAPGELETGTLHGGELTQVHAKERQLEREISQLVESGVPGVEVLAVELAGPDRFTVFVDHAQGVDHALCERVTNHLRAYLREYSIEVSSPGFERPLRKQAHFARAVGRRVALRTAAPIDGRKRFRGELLSADDRSLRLDAQGGEAISIPYDAIVRGNLIDEG
jgi:ribosome maturation factor RimP